jgi:transcriptional regulator with XRE-family HTH domain
MSVQLPAAPEAQLIQRQREAADPPLSRRQAAAKAGISPSQWSDVERGSKKAGQGTVVPVRATAETLARMAQAVGTTASDLAAAGRQDAANLLANLDHQQELSRRLAAIPGVGVAATHLLPTAELTELLPAIAASLGRIDASSLPEAAKRDLTGWLVSNLINDVARRHTELLLLLRIATGTTAS